MYRSLLLGLPVAGLLIAAVCLSADAPKQPNKPDRIMQRKLELAQQLLSDLATEDFEGMEASAKALNGLTRLEQWLHLDSQAYTVQLHNFRLASDELVRNAAEKNIDGAAYCYMQLTQSCVECHKVLRGRKI